MVNKLCLDIECLVCHQIVPLRSLVFQSPLLLVPLKTGNTSMILPEISMFRFFMFIFRSLPGLFISWLFSSGLPTDILKHPKHKDTLFLLHYDDSFIN